MNRETGRAWRLLGLIGLALAMLGCSAQSAPAGQVAQDVWILAADGDRQVEAASSSLARRSEDALATAWQAAGSRTFDRSALGLARESGRLRQSELVDAVRGRGASGDLVLLFRLHRFVLEERGGTRGRLRLEGRLLDAFSGQRLAQAEVDSGQPLAMPPTCTAACIDDRLGGEARRLGQELAALLLGQVDRGGQSASGHRPSPALGSQTLTLVLDGYTQSERAGLEAALAQLPGYRQHRLIDSGHTRSSWWYVSDLDAATLQRELREVIADEGLPSYLRFANGELLVRKTRGAVPPAAQTGEGWVW